MNAVSQYQLGMGGGGEGGGGGSRGRAIASADQYPPAPYALVSVIRMHHGCRVLRLDYF